MAPNDVVAALEEMEVQFLRLRYPFGRHEKQTYGTPHLPWAREANASLFAKGLIEQWLHPKTREVTYRLNALGADVVRALYEFDKASEAFAPPVQRWPR